MGIVMFKNIQEAIRAGFLIESPIPDSEGFLHARMQTERGLAIALVQNKTRWLDALSFTLSSYACQTIV